MLATALPQPTRGLMRREVHNLSDAENQPGWDLKLMQMSAGEVRGDTHLLEIEGLQLVRTTYAKAVLHHCGCARGEGFMFGIPLRMGGDGLFNGGLWREGIFMARAGREFNTVCPPTDLLCAVVQRDELARYVQASEMLDITGWLDKRSLILNDAQLTRDVGTRINDILSACFDDEADLSEPLLRRALLDSVLEVLGPVVAQQTGAPMPAFREISRSLIVQRAREFAVANVHKPIQVVDMCKAAGVSRRALQFSFQDVLGVSPMTYLRLVRLNGTRQALLAPTKGLQVRDVVARWGFWHLSRFSADYRELFGELPSETLRRSACSLSR